MILVFSFAAINGLWLEEVVGQSSEPNVVWTDDYVDVTLCADEQGNVCLSKIANALNANTLGQSIAPLLPDMTINLSNPSAWMLISLANHTLGEKASLSLDRSPEGKNAIRFRLNLDEFSSSQQQPPFKPSVESDPTTERYQDKSPIVLFIHGLRGQADTFDAIREYLRSSGLRTASVTYDGRKSLAVSAREVSEQVESVLSKDTDTRLILVGHSMGGLIARYWVEDPAVSSERVARIITVGTPHGGSRWAELPPFPDLFVNDEIDAKMIVAMILGRASTASVRDLQPNSTFLSGLASRPRNDSVGYTTIIGSQSPINEQIITMLQSELTVEVNEDGSTNRLAEILKELNELRSGKGDGFVSMQNAMLEGVSDQVVVKKNHITFFDVSDDGQQQEVFDIVRSRCMEELD